MPFLIVLESLALAKVTQRMIPKPPSSFTSIIRRLGDQTYPAAPMGHAFESWSPILSFPGSEPLRLRRVISTVSDSASAQTPDGGRQWSGMLRRASLLERQRIFGQYLCTRPDTP